MTSWFATASRSLTWRLVAVVVLIVAATTVIIAAATTVAMRSNLDSRLDADLEGEVARASRVHAGAPPLGARLETRATDQSDFSAGQAFGTLRAAFPTGGEARGFLLSPSDNGRGFSATALTGAQLVVLAKLSAASAPSTVELPELGSYRVGAAESADGGIVLAGLPRSDVEDTIADLTRFEVVATLVGVLLAAAVATFAVRRQMSPLRQVARTAHRVAELPLASGTIDLDERVPKRLTDERNEVGEVGHALNRLLAHVETALEARHRSEMKVRQFVADASHELRTPLATIAGYSELARLHPDNDVALRTALRKVDEESHRMTSLVEALLLLARLDAESPLSTSTVDLTALLVKATNDARVLAPDHEWRLELPDNAIQVSGDLQQLHQVVTNLLTNARKHTPQGTTVTIRGHASGFSIHDDGPGFPPELVDRAFERFTRADATRHREGGAGLGLALVASIVDAHGGTVELTSSPGDTTITVHLPMSDPHAARGTEAG